MFNLKCVVGAIQTGIAIMAKNIDAKTIGKIQAELDKDGGRCPYQKGFCKVSQQGKCTLNPSRDGHHCPTWDKLHGVIRDWRGTRKK